MQVRIISQQGCANPWNEYDGYKKLFAGDAECPVIELGCWAHARRKFFDLQVSGAHPQAAEAMRRIGQLYAIEEVARAMDHVARAAHRQQNSVPILTDMHGWLIRLRVATADGGGLARAIDYSLNRWPSLIRHAQAGNLPIQQQYCQHKSRRLNRWSGWALTMMPPSTTNQM